MQCYQQPNQFAGVRGRYGVYVAGNQNHFRNNIVRNTFTDEFHIEQITNKLAHGDTNMNMTGRRTDFLSSQLDTGRWLAMLYGIQPLKPMGKWVGYASQEEHPVLGKNLEP